MNKQDAIKILQLEGDFTPETVKKAYRTQCKKFHPDVNPAGEEMIKVVNEAFEVLKDESGNAENEQHEYADIFNDALGTVFSVIGLKMEICGAWIWVTGDTMTHKEMLKNASFKWAKKKKAWYFRPADYKSRGRSKMSLDDIRTKYGSAEVKNGKQQKRLAA